MKQGNPKLALLFVVMCCFPNFYPQTDGQAQPAPVRAEPLHSKEAAIRQAAAASLDTALQVAATLPKLSKDLTMARTRRRRVNLQHDVAKPQIVLRYQGDIYEAAPVEWYGNYGIVDLDSFLQETADPGPVNEFLEADPPQVDTVPAAAPPKKSFLQKLLGR